MTALSPDDEDHGGIFHNNLCEDFVSSFDVNKDADHSGRERKSFREMKVKPIQSNVYLSEACLWTKWEHRGDLCAAQDSSVVLLNVERFITSIKQYPAAAATAMAYSRRFVAWLNIADQMSGVVTDVVCPQTILEQWSERDTDFEELREIRASLVAPKEGKPRTLFSRGNSS